MSKARKPKRKGNSFSYGDPVHGAGGKGDFGLTWPEGKKPKPEGAAIVDPPTPPRFSPEVAEKLAHGVELGLGFKKACRAVGIPTTTGKRWRRNGKRDLAAGVDSPYAQLEEVLQAAESDVEDKALRSVLVQAEADWRAGAWYLERTRPDRWSKQATARVAELLLERIFERIDSTATPEEAARFRELLSGSIDLDVGEPKP